MQVLKTEILNELYDRTESRIKDLHSLRQLLIAIKSFEEFSQHKITFTQFLFDIEDELREALQNAKSAYIEIKELKDQLELSKQRFGILENKNSNAEGYSKELKTNIKECLDQMKFQDSLRISMEKYVGELENKIKNLQLENKILKSENFERSGNSYDCKDDLNKNDFCNNNENYKINKCDYNNNDCGKSKKIEFNVNLKQENSKPSANYETLEKEEIKKTDFSSNINLISDYANYNNAQKNENLSSHSKNNTSNNAKMDYNYNKNAAANDISKNKSNNEPSEESMDNSFLYKVKEKLNYSQYNDILSERENSKKLINDFIKDSLSFNYNNNNNISENYNFSPTKQNLLYNYDNSSLLNNKNANNNNRNNNNDNELAANSENKKLITFGRNEENKNHASDNNYNNNINNSYKDLNNLNQNQSNFYPQANTSLQQAQANFKNQAINASEKNNQNKNISEKNKETETQNMKNMIENNSESKSKTNDSSAAKKEVKDYNNNNNYVKSESFSPKRISKADKILEIVVKIRTIEDISSIVSHLFGEDVLDKIISPDVDEELIEKVDVTIQEIERLMQKEYTETEPLQDPPKRMERNHPSIIEEKDEESTLMNNTLNNKESSTNIIINNQLSEFVNNNNSHNNRNLNSVNYHPSSNNPNIQEQNKITTQSASVTNNSKNINNQIDFEQSNYDQIINNNNNNKNFENKAEVNNNNNNINYQMLEDAEDYNSTASLQSPSNINIKTLNEVESNYSKMLKSNNKYNNANNNPYNNNNNNHTNQNNYITQNTHTNPNLPSNSLNNLSHFENSPNWPQNNNNNKNNNNNIQNPYKIYSTNSNDISKTSYDILSENNLRRSGSKFKKSFASNNRSFSKPSKEIYSSDSAAASRINFEKSLRTYEDYYNNNNNDNREAAGFAGNTRLNTSGNVNKKIFNNYMKNKGDLFDNKIIRRYDAEYECRKKSNSKPKNRINRGENSHNSIDLKSIKEMQRFRELYEKFKHLAVQNENSNFNPNVPSQGFIKRPSNNPQSINLQKGNNHANKSNVNTYLFNDDTEN